MMLPGRVLCLESFGKLWNCAICSSFVAWGQYASFPFESTEITVVGSGVANSVGFTHKLLQVVSDAGGIA